MILQKRAGFAALVQCFYGGGFPREEGLAPVERVAPFIERHPYMRLLKFLAKQFNPDKLKG
jgi:hypothetical protein